MILTPHLLAGATLVTLIDNLPLALLLAFFSHYILDIIPHWDYLTPNIKAKNWWHALPEFLAISFDFFSGIILILLLAENWRLALVGALFATLSDILTFLTILFPEINLLEKHNSLHGEICHWFRSKKISVFWKIASQIGLILLAIWMIL